MMFVKGVRDSLGQIGLCSCRGSKEALKQTKTNGSLGREAASGYSSRCYQKTTIEKGGAAERSGSERWRRSPVRDFGSSRPEAFGIEVYTYAAAPRATLGSEPRSLRMEAASGSLNQRY